MKVKGFFAALPFLFLVLPPASLSVRADAIVVFNEVMYHPATNEAALEWVELYNQNAVDVDLSGWSFSDGIDYTFPEGTVIAGRGYLVVAIDPFALMARTGLTGASVVGPFQGRLANGGEDLDLRDGGGRHMDSLNYGVDGDWPAGADGAGVSLAKRHPDLGSRGAEHWTVSAELGGTPGRANFSAMVLTGAETRPVTFTSAWRYDDAGIDRGAAWRDPEYDDGAWAAGAGLFFDEESVLPAPKNTPIAPGRAAYYFRTTFDFAGDPALALLSFRAIVDDGAVFYLNGAEIGRFNMPAGEVTYDTMALAAVGNAAVGETFRVASDPLRTGPNVLAVEVHQSSSVVNDGVNVIGAFGFTASWDGSDGDYATPNDPAPAPPNDAMASRGVDAIVSSNPTLGISGEVNDGLYGDDRAWRPAGDDASPFVILRFNRAIPVTSIAWSRDNGNAVDANCGGTCTDASLGNYTFQFTLVDDPGAVLNNSINPSNGWRTVATVQQLSAQPGFTPHLRHRFAMATSTGDPVLATGIRLRVPAGAILDELEINPPAVGGDDAAFGLEFVVTDILPPPPRLTLNEIAAASSDAFWVEILNAGETPADLGGAQIARGGDGSPRFELPARTLSPGEIVAFTQAELGFGAAAGQIVSLYAADGFAFLDAAVVRDRPRARYPDGEGEFFAPAAPTPGQPNQVTLRDAVVIHEIMYHHPPSDPTPAVTSNLTVVEIGGVWRYDDRGVDLGTAWREPGYNDGGWAAGSGLFAFNAGALPAAVGTVLGGDADTYYFRTGFHFSGGGASNLTLSLRTVLDDGAVFYLNGVEFHRRNMPAGPVNYGTSANVAVADAAYVDTLELPADALVPGLNVVAVEVHQLTSGNTSSGIVLSGGGLTLVEEGPFGGMPPDNLALLPGVTPFALDSLAGYPIHDIGNLNDGNYGNSFSWIGNSGSPGFAGLNFGGTFTVAGIAFGRDNLGTFTDRTLGLYTLQYTRAAAPGAATPVTENPETGWATIGTLQYQGTGSGLFANPSRRHRYTFDPVDATGIRLLVPGTGLAGGTCLDELEVNPPDTTGDIAFGAQLALTTTLVPAAPFTESDEEWVELRNRTAQPVDLGGWSLGGTVDYFFPTGAVIEPNGFLVVARDAAELRVKWPETANRVAGDFEGRMSEGDTLILRDALGNTADRLRIPETAFSDGGGSSLELIDPRADNARAGAWRDSEESGRSQWREIRYRKVAGQRYGSSLWNEFRLGLLDVGEALVDDVSVVRDPDGARQELIQNGDFESVAGNTHWRLLGSHEKSAIVIDPDDPGNRVLKIVATAPARTSHNHVESSYAGNTPIVDGQEYEVSFRARWRAGTPLLHSSSYHQRLAQVNVLPLPARLGTPGAENSARVANAGPTFSGLNHAPVVPAAGEPVFVSVRARDPDGVAAVTLHYRLNPATPFTDVAMAPQSDGTFSVAVPGQTAGRVVQFYVAATDGLGAMTTSPAAGPDSRALFQVADSQGTALAAHEIRVIQLDADRDFMHRSTNVMSQMRRGATVVYNRSEAFYDAAVRLKGSAAGRIRDGDNFVGYDIRFPSDHLFRGVHRTVGIDRSGRAPVVRQQHEIYVLHMFEKAGLPVHHTDLCYFIAPKTAHTGTAILQLGGYNRLFVEEQYGEEGSTFNMDITYEPSRTVDGTFEGIKEPVPHQGHHTTDLQDLGDDREQYRVPFSLRTGERRDDFGGIMRLAKAMGAAQPEFDATIAEALNVDEALRVTALTILCGIGDIYFSSTGGLEHNVRIYTPADGGPAEFLPWDMDFVSTQSSSSSLYPAHNLGKFMNHPQTRRRYLSHVLDLVTTVFNTDYMNPWLEHYGGVVGQNFTGAASYISSRRGFALNQLPPAAPFAITTHLGENFAVNTNVTVLSGTGWLDIWDFEVNGIPTAGRWSSDTAWSLVVPLVPGTNHITVQGLTRAGDRPASMADTIIVTNTLPAELQPVVINEWMADNAGPTGYADPADGLFQDWFELFNPNTRAVDLGGYHLTDDLSNPTKFTIPVNTVIGARGFLLVWADEDGSQNPPVTAQLHANFRLGAGGEVLALFAPDGLAPQHTVSFGAQTLNVSEGLFPDGAVGSRQFMPDWTPGAPNRTGTPATPEVTGFSLEDGRLTLRVSSLPGRSYRLEYADDLSAPVWMPAGEWRAASDETLEFAETLAIVPQRFYRVRLE